MPKRATPGDGATATVSVIVRTRDSAATVGATLASVREQSVAAQIVVVDSGSRDSTLDLVAAVCDLGGRDVLVRLAPETFTFGGALNAGAAAATGSVVVALSSHSSLPGRDWLSLASAHVRAGAAAAFGTTTDGDGVLLQQPLIVHHEYLRAHPYWGLSNHASAWSRASWEAEPFDETLKACEDREWSWRVSAHGGHLVADPALLVPGDHRRAAGIRPYFRRLVKEATALGPLRPLPPYSIADAARDLVASIPSTPLISARSAPARRTRLVEVAARWQAGRVAGRNRS